MWSSPTPQPRPQGSHPMPQGQQPHPGYPYPQGHHVPYSRVAYPYPGGYPMHGQYSPRAYHRPQMPQQQQQQQQPPPPQQQQQQQQQGPPIVTQTTAKVGGPPSLEPQAASLANGYLASSAYTASPISSAKDGDSSTLPPGSPASNSFQDDDNSMISSPSTPAMPPTFVQPGGSALTKLLELGNEPDRRAWTEKYMQFMEERGKPLANLPQVAKQPLDLYRLYVGVKDRGGVLEVVKSKKWKEVSQFIHINASASAAYTLRRNYTKYLVEFEYHFDRDGADSRPVVQEIEAMTKKKSKASEPPVQAPKAEEAGGRSTPLPNGCAQPPADFYQQQQHHHQQHQQRGPNGAAGGLPPYSGAVPPPHHHHHHHHQPPLHPAGQQGFHHGYQPPPGHYGQANGQAGYPGHQQQLGSPLPPPGPPGAWAHRPPAPDAAGAKPEASQSCTSSHQLTKLQYMVTSHQPRPLPAPSQTKVQQQQQQQYYYQQQYQQQLARAHHGHRQTVPLDPRTVEGAEPRLKYGALGHKDVGAVDLRRVAMALRSGLLLEASWALNVLNVLLADAGTRDSVSLPRLPGLLDAVVDVWRRQLGDLHPAGSHIGAAIRRLEADSLPAADRVSGVAPPSGHVRTGLWPPACGRKRCRAPADGADDADDRVFVADDEESTNLLRLRCRSAINVIRSLTFLPGNEPVIGNHGGFLRTAATLLAWRGEWCDFDADDLLVSLSNVSGHCSLDELPEAVCRPLVSALLARLQDDAWFGLACEALAKLCVRPENVDLLLATPTAAELRQALQLLCSRLRHHDQVQRELALSLLAYLLSHADNAGACELAAACSPGFARPVLDCLEQVEGHAVRLCQQLGPRALHDSPELLRQAPGVPSLDLLHRAALALRCLAERGGQEARRLLLAEEDRLLMLCMSSVLQPALTDPLADCLRSLADA